MYHPLVAFVLTGFIFVMWVYDRLINNEHLSVMRNNSRYVFASFVISLIWSVWWTSAFRIWRSMMTDVMANITVGGQTSFNSLIGEIAYASQYYSVLTFFFKTYTGQIIIISLAAFCLIFLWRIDISKHKLRRLVLLLSPMLMIVIALVFLYLENPGFGPTRLITFFILLCTLFAGYILYELIRKSKNYDYHASRSRVKSQYFVTFIISLVLLFLSVFGVQQFYPSRYVLQPNLQVTHTEFTGMNWFIRSKDIKINETSFTVDIHRWASVFLTEDDYLNEGYLFYGAATPTNLRIPWHFGYDKKRNLGQFYINDLYMILSTRDRLVYEEIWPELASIRLQNEDFNRIEKDTSIYKLYSNGGLDVHYVQSTANAIFQIDPFNWAK
jgi:hypothetical protein